MVSGPEAKQSSEDRSSYATVPNSAPTPAVIAMASAPQNVMRPHLAVVEPRLVFGLAGEKALHAAEGVGGPVRCGLRQGGCAGQGGGAQQKVAALHNRIVSLMRTGHASMKSINLLVLTTDPGTMLIQRPAARHPAGTM